MPQDNVIIVIPTYNEANNIELLADKIFELGEEFSLLIIDDNSPDGTWQKVLSLQKKYPRLRLIKRDRKQGLGSAYRLAFREALKSNYEIVIQMDADLSHNPCYIPSMLNLIKEHDVVIGSRYIKGAGVSNWLMYRVFLSRLANIFCRFLLRVPVNDMTSGFKCMRKRVLKDINFSQMLSEGYVFQVEMVFLAFFKSFKIIEYPIAFEGRYKGDSKISLYIIVEAAFKVIILALHRISKNVKRK